MLVLLAVSAASASGPHLVGWSDRSFDDPVAGQVLTRVYYPAAAAGPDAAPDRTSGPYPLAGFLHGWLGSAWMYDGICADLASHGYVVASLDTETGLALDMDRFADDAVALLHWTQAQSEAPEDLLAGLVSDADWTALGHSMGGATLARVLGQEPRIRTAVAFMPYLGEAADYDAVRAWDGSLLLLSGTHDTTAPPAMQEDWMSAADQTSRSLLVAVTDMGHQAVTDLRFGEDPMDDVLQFAIVSSLATTFVRAEHGGDEALWAELTASRLPEVETRLWSRSHDPALWARYDAGRVSLGVAGLPGSTAEVFLGSGSTAEGLVGEVSVATLELPLGVAEATVDVPAGWPDELWVSVRTDGEDGEVWTRSVALTSSAEPPATVGATPPADLDPTGASTARSSGATGCATAPGASVVLWPWWLGLAARRRRD